MAKGKRFNSGSTGRKENRIKKNNGETMVETLVAMLIVVLPFLSLAAAVMTSTKINDQIKNSNYAFVSYDEIEANPDFFDDYKTDKQENIEASFLSSTGDTGVLPVDYYIITKTYKDTLEDEEFENSYYYFELHDE